MIFPFLNFLFIILIGQVLHHVLWQFSSLFLRSHFEDRKSPQLSFSNPIHALTAFYRPRNNVSPTIGYYPSNPLPKASDFLILLQFFQFLTFYLSWLHLSYLFQFLSIVSESTAALFMILTLNLFYFSTLRLDRASLVHHSPFYDTVFPFLSSFNEPHQPSLVPSFIKPASKYRQTFNVLLQNYL